MELLRAQQQRLDRTRNLTGLRTRAWALLEALSTDPLIQAVEERITAHLSALTAGVGDAADMANSDGNRAPRDKGFSTIPS